MAKTMQRGRASTRVILNGVPKIGYNVRLCPFPGSLEACMTYLGEDFDYDYIMGITGAAFRRFFEKDDGGNVDLMYLAPEPHARAFEALGWGFSTVPNDEAAMLTAIKQSISAGKPVISFGIIGPPEAGVITGYDRDGEVLIGYSYFHDGLYRQSDWFDGMEPGPYGLIVIGDKARSKPSEREMLPKTLEWIIDLARTSPRASHPDHASGLAAYAAWADALEVHDDYPAADRETMGTRLMVHGDQCLMLEERKSAATFLRQIADAVPEVAGELRAAARCYDDAASLGMRVWPWDTCDYGSDTLIKGLADRTVRRRIAKAVRVARDREAQAVEHLEAALAAL